MLRINYNERIFMTINIFLLILMLVSAVWAVMGRSLLKATIGLAMTSAIITILIFKLNSPLAAVFELSVCTGLITVVFVSAISLTKPLTHKETIAASRDRLKRFIYLPLVLILAGAALLLFRIPKDFAISMLPKGVTYDVRHVLWNMRQLDLFGQIIIMIAGALGIVVLFKGDNDDR